MDSITFSKIYRREAGFSLLETIVSVAILGLVAVVFMSGLSTLYKSDATARGKALSEGLARSQFESIKSQTYISYVIGHGNYTFIPGPSEYVIEAMITPINFFLKYFLFSLTIHNLFRLFLQEHSQVFPDP